MTLKSKYKNDMTKAEIVTNIADNTGLERVEVQSVLDDFMRVVRSSMLKGDSVYLRGFGSFVLKKRAEKTARNISKNTSLVIPAHNTPYFRPSKSFVEEVRKQVPVR